eukprot:112754-Amphidinium_carterae.4
MQAISLERPLDELQSAARHVHLSSCVHRVQFCLFTSRAKHPIFMESTCSSTDNSRDIIAGCVTSQLVIWRAF